MSKIVKKYWLDLVFLSAIALLVPLFFYKLGQSSLVSWDEAWYAEIARNILISGNLFQLFFNGSPYSDHPPAGFWFIALSYKLFGVSDFSARFAPAVFGFLSLFTVYFLGRDLFTRSVGFIAAIGLVTSPWFLFRARSGNLDTILTFFFLLTLLLAFKAARNPKYLPLLSISFTLLCLTKSMVPFVILPALIVIFWNSKAIFKTIEFRLSFVLFLIVFGGWLLIQVLDKPGFLNYYTKIGLPGVSNETNFLDNLKLTKDYLHNGIGRWFWPGVFALIFSLVFRSRQFLVLTVFSAAFFVPFIFSERGHIWHLIPLHPILILSFIGFFYTILGIAFDKAHFQAWQRAIKWKWLWLKEARRIFQFLFLLVSLGYLGLFQLRNMWETSIDIPAFITDEAILSEEAGKYPEKFFLDDDFVPAAVFYSKKSVVRVRSDGLTELFEVEKTFLLITKDWRLEQAGIKSSEYKILKKDRDKILVRKSNLE